MSETTREEHTSVSSADEQSGPALEDIIDESQIPPRSAHRVGNITRNGTATTEQRHKQLVETTSEPDCQVLVAIPAYNEEVTIGGIVRDASEHADQVLVVDDGSDDDTAAKAETAGAIVIEHSRNRGYGAALKTAFRGAKQYGTRYLVVLDGDGQHDPVDVPQLVETQEHTDAHLVIGSRFVNGATSNPPLYRRIGLKIINVLTNLSMGVVRTASWVSDTQSGFRAYDREAIETLAVDESIGDWMDASTDILYHAHHQSYVIEEVPIEVEYDVENVNSQAPISHCVVLVRNILKTIERDRPLTALAVPGFGLTFSGVGFGYWALINYINSGTFSVGLALTATFLVLVGLFACFTAIVLHSLSTYFSGNRRNGGPFR
jgi:glycosyltransferase involved in cell wall biosynthesis